MSVMITVLVIVLLEVERLMLSIQVAFPTVWMFLLFLLKFLTIYFTIFKVEARLGIPKGPFALGDNDTDF